MKKRRFPDLGVGTGLRIPFFEEWEELYGGRVPTSVQWGEIVTENLFAFPGLKSSRGLERLLKVREQIPVALHGVSLSIGSTDPLDLSYLKKLKELVEIVKPAIVSDHLCWTGVLGQNFHDLLPLPYTRETLNHVVGRLGRVQEFLGREILIENLSSYIEITPSDFTESQFLGEVSRKSGCGILLDLNNILVSESNHGNSRAQYLSDLPLESVGQIHLAGHTNRGWIRVDTHGEDLSPDLWEFYQEFTKANGPVSVMIERDMNFPSWKEMERDLRILRKIHNGKEVHHERTIQSRRLAASLS